MDLLTALILAAILFATVAATAYRGSFVNQAVASAWWDEIIPLLKEHMKDLDYNLHCLSWWHYEGFASGNSKIAYVLATLRTIPRQEFFCGTILRPLLLMVNGKNPAGSTSSCTRDKMVFEFGLTGINERFSFVFGRKLSSARLKKVDPNLTETVARRKLASGDVGAFCCLSDSQAFVDQLAKCPRVKEFMKVVSKECALDFVSLHISDLILSERYLGKASHIARLELAIPLNGSFNKVKQMLNLTFQVIDELSSLKVSDEARSQVKASRLPLVRVIAEQDRARAKEAEEKRRAESEAARLAAMTPEERRKLELKKEKKAQKGRGPGVKVLKR